MDLLFPFTAYWWVYAAFTAGVLAVLAVDLGVFHRQAHAVTFRESLAWSGGVGGAGDGRQLRLLPLRADPVRRRRGVAGRSRVPDRLPGREGARRRQRLRLRAGVRLLRHPAAPPAPGAVLRDPRRPRLPRRVRGPGLGPDAVPRRRRRLRRHPADLRGEDAVRPHQQCRPGGQSR